MSYSTEELAGLIKPEGVHRNVYTDPEIAAGRGVCQDADGAWLGHSLRKGWEFSIEVKSIGARAVMALWRKNAAPESRQEDMGERWRPQDSVVSFLALRDLGGRLTGF